MTDAISRIRQVIRSTDAPLTRSGIARELRDMGLNRGDLVLVHTSLSALGWVCGGAQTVIEALFDVLGSGGTLVMPGFSPGLSDPAGWNAPSVPENWYQEIRDQMPLFCAFHTPTGSVGRVPEAFRHWTGVQRSLHPKFSFLACGPLADDITISHPLGNALGPETPLGTMHHLGARVLMLGSGWNSCSSFHLAEYLVDAPVVAQENLPVGRVDGVTQWNRVADVARFEAHYPEIGRRFDASGPVRRGVGGAAALLEMRDAVAAARQWFEAGNYDRLRHEPG
jgi:aminoglycoside 3-N-acetyltransferase